MSHMPAPWTLHGEFDADVTVDIKSADDRYVCELAAYTDDWTEEEIANARLIATAPELLEACKAILASFHESVRSEQGLDEFPTLKLVADAIAKAEGR